MTWVITVYTLVGITNASCIQFCIRLLYYTGRFTSSTLVFPFVYLSLAVVIGIVPNALVNSSSRRLGNSTAYKLSLAVAIAWPCCCCCFCLCWLPLVAWGSPLPEGGLPLLPVPGPAGVRFRPVPFCLVARPARPPVAVAVASAVVCSCLPSVRAPAAPLRPVLFLLGVPLVRCWCFVLGPSCWSFCSVGSFLLVLLFRFFPLFCRFLWPSPGVFPSGSWPPGPPLAPASPPVRCWLCCCCALLLLWAMSWRTPRRSNLYVVATVPCPSPPPSADEPNPCRLENWW